MQSRARLFGHSIHAMLIAFPIGLFVTAVLFDVVHLISPARPLTVAGYYMIIAGVVGGLVAAVFGFIDYLGIPSGTRAKALGRVHGLGNVVVVALFLVSWWLRRGTAADPPASALVMSFLGVAIASVTAWLGGELVERLGVGVDDGAHVDAPSSLSGQPAGSKASTRPS